MSIPGIDEQEREHLSDLLCAQYGFEKISWIKSAEGLSSTNDFIQADAQSFVLKKFRIRDEKTVERIEEVTAFLHLHGLPVSLPIQNIGHLRHIFFHGSFFALFPMIEGMILHEPSFTDFSLSQAAQLLVRFHQLSSEQVPAVLPDQTLLVRHLEDVKSQAREIHKKIQSASLGEKVDALANELVNAKIAMLEGMDFQMLSDFAAAGDFVHGDFHNENLLFDTKGRVLLLLDFEKVHFGNRLEDVFHFIQHACCNSGYQKENLNKARHFFDAYAQPLPISPSELRLGVQYSLYQEASSFFLEDLLYTTRNKSLVEYLKRDRLKAAYFQQHTETFIHFFLSR